MLTAAGCAQSEQASADDTKTEAAEGTNEEENRGRKATLELEGEPGTQFSGDCTIGNEEPETIGGRVPESFTYNLKRKPLECEISSRGEVQVDLTIGKNVRSVQQLSGAP